MTAMEINGHDVPDGLYYTKEHEWMKIEAERCRVGVTDYAQKLLHEVVFVDLPPLGRSVAQGETLGTVESVKAISELYSPVSGEIVERNDKLIDSPELVNQEPYGTAWIVVIKPSRLEDDCKSLLDAQGYIKFLQDVAKKK